MHTICKVEVSVRKHCDNLLNISGGVLGIKTPVITRGFGGSWKREPLRRECDGRSVCDFSFVRESCLLSPDSVRELALVPYGNHVDLEPHSRRPDCGNGLIKFAVSAVYPANQLPEVVLTPSSSRTCQNISRWKRCVKQPLDKPVCTELTVEPKGSCWSGVRSAMDRLSPKIKSVFSAVRPSI